MPYATNALIVASELHKENAILNHENSYPFKD